MCRLTAISAIAVLCAVAGCSSGDRSAPAPTTVASDDAVSTSPAVPVPAKPAPVDVAAVDTSNVEAVAESVATASVTWDTTSHASEYAPLREVAALMTPELAAQYPEPAADAHPYSTPEWAAARKVGAYNVPSVFTGEDVHDKPIDTADTAYRVYEATWTWVDPKGSSIVDDRDRSIYLTLTRQPDGRWLVSTLDYTEL